MTQWVFGHTRCKCQNPFGLPVSVQGAGSGEPGGILEKQEDKYDEPELGVSADVFPLERYKPLSIIGEGTSGAVYLCRDRLLNKKLAVKVLKKVAPESLVAFQKEAKTTAKLDHRNIVKILDFGATEHSSPYMVLEYRPGKTIKKIIEDDGTIYPPTAAVIAIEIADGLAYAHGHDIFHRDLQSGNILVNLSNDQVSVCILDFGLAKVKHQTMEATILDGKTIVGTPFYMSPDQANGKPYDSRSEIYSLGCILFEMLTGQPPLVGSTPLETLRMHAKVEAPSILELMPPSAISEPLAKVVSKCLQKEPELRYQSMQLFRLDLLDCLSSARKAGMENTLVVASKVERKKSKQKTSKILLAVSTACASLIVLHLAKVATEAQKEKKTVRKKEPRSVADRYYSSPEWRLALIRKGIKGPLEYGERSYFDGIHYKTDRNSPGAIIRIDFSACAPVDEDLRAITKLPNLVDVCIDENLNFTTNGLKELWKIKNLNTLTISNMPISSPGWLDLFSGSHRLVALDFNNVPGINDGVIKVIVERNPALVELLLNRTAVTSQSAEFLKPLKNLRRLNVQGVKFDKASFETLTQLPVRELYVSDNCVSSDALAETEFSTKLEKFDLEWTGKMKWQILEPTLAALSKKSPRVKIVYFHF